MTLPGVTIFESDNQLGVLTSAAGGKIFVVVGPCKAGPFNLPSAYARAKDLLTTFEGGPAVEAAAYYLDKYEQPVVIVRTEVSTDPVVSAVTHSKADGTSGAAGSSVVTFDTDPQPVDDHDLALQILTSGTVGTAGIMYRLSYDAGRTWEARQALGTATSLTFPDSGVVFKFAAGSVTAGDLHEATTKTAYWNPDNLLAALAPLGLTQRPWAVALIVGDMDGAAFDAAESVNAHTNGEHIWLGNARLPEDDETEAEYAVDADIAGLSADKASKHPGVGAGACKMSSSISGRVYRRPAIWAAAARQGWLVAMGREHINMAERDLGPLPGVTIRTANGDPDEHDEAINPGLDDLRFITLRTWPRKQGVYVTLPRVFAPTGSDFELIPTRLVINIAREALEDYLADVLHKPLLVSRTSGFILPAIAKDIEVGADAVLSTVLLAGSKASGAFFKMSRTDNMLSLPKLTCGAKVLSLTYPRWIDLDLSLTNPALLQIQAV